MKGRAEIHPGKIRMFWRLLFFWLGFIFASFPSERSSDNIMNPVKRKSKNKLPKLFIPMFLLVEKVVNRFLKRKSTINYVFRSAFVCLYFVA